MKFLIPLRIISIFKTLATTTEIYLLTYADSELFVSFSQFLSFYFVNSINMAKIYRYYFLNIAKNNGSSIILTDSAMIWVKAWMQDCFVSPLSVISARSMIFLNRCIHARLLSSSSWFSFNVLRWSEMCQIKLTTLYS